MKRHYTSASGYAATIGEHADGTATLSVAAGRVRTRCTYRSLCGAHAAMLRLDRSWGEETNE